MRRIIIFEGISGSGKSTLEDMYRKYNDYYDYTVHRFVASKFVYSHLYARPIFLDETNKTQKDLLSVFEVRHITLTCSHDTAKVRKDLLMDPNVEKDIEKANTLFQLFHEKYCLFPRAIVSTDQNIKQSFEQVLEFIHH